MNTLPDAASAAETSWISSTLSIAGFSVTTFLPAARAARAIALWTSFGVQMKTMSTLGSARASSRCG